MFIWWTEIPFFKAIATLLHFQRICNLFVLCLGFYHTNLPMREFRIIFLWFYWPHPPTNFFRGSLESCKSSCYLGQNLCLALYPIPFCCANPQGCFPHRSLFCGVSPKFANMSKTFANETLLEYGLMIFYQYLLNKIIYWGRKLKVSLDITIAFSFNYDSDAEVLKVLAILKYNVFQKIGSQDQRESII